MKWAFARSVPNAVIALLLVAGAIAATPQRAAAQLERATVGIWAAHSHFYEGVFRHCAIYTSQADERSRLIFALNRNNFTLGIEDRSWSLVRDQQIIGYYQIDGGPRINIRGSAALPSLILMHLRFERITFEQLRMASVVRVHLQGAPQPDFSFSIAGSAGAFDRLHKCLVVGLASTRPTWAPRGDNAEQAPGQAPARPAPPPAARAQRPASPASPTPPERPASPGVAERATPPSKPAGDVFESAGTGFYISPAGHIVTAEHVIRGCKSLRVQAIGDVAAPAAVVAKSVSDDLALLKAEVKHAAVTPVRIGALRLGEQIVLFGFPLPGALASSGNLTTGNIAALAGLRDDHRMMQISAPAQPGNSGGPVFDLRGRAVGVVVSGLSLRFARATGSLPQNINFAVKASVVSSFLEAHGISVEQGGAEGDLAVADVAERARPVTVRIECLS